MLFLMRDAMIVPVGPPSELKPRKMDELPWYLSKHNHKKKLTRKPKRVHITREKVKSDGPTEGCRGCRFALQNLNSEKHSESCRRRFESLMRARGDPLLARAELRLGKS